MLTWSRYNIWAEEDGAAFVFNGVSGALVQMTSEKRAKTELAVAAGPADPEDEATLVQLVRMSVVVSDDVDELARLERRYEAARSAGPFAVTIVPTVACNLDCPYCYEDKQPGRMTPEVAEAVVDLVRSQLHRPSVYVTWFGGEPLLAPDLVLGLSDRLIASCDDAGVPYRAHIVTNGWFLDGEMARALAARRVELAQVTLDGPANVHDRYRPRRGGGSTFERIVDNIGEAADHVRIGLRVNVDRGNVGEVEALLDELRSRGLGGRISVAFSRIGGGSNPEAPGWRYETPRFSVAEMAAVESALESATSARGLTPSALPEPLSTPCGAVRDDGRVLGPNGQVWRCWEDVGDETKVVGSVFAPGDEDAPAGVRLFDDFSPFRDRQCRSCVALPVCMGGCPASKRHSDHDEQCRTFRHNHRQRIRRAAAEVLGRPVPTHDLQVPGDGPQATPQTVAAVPVVLRLVDSPSRLTPRLQASTRRQG